MIIKGVEFKTEAFTEELTRSFAHFMPKAIVSILILGGFWVVGLFVQRIIQGIGHEFEEHKRIVIALCGQVLYISILAFGVITALGTLGINISALVAGLGLTGFALGFAFKDVLSNSLAGVLILFYRPFSYKDRISVTGLEGEVINIDLRYTTLQDNQKIYLIPNSTLLTNPIIMLRPV